MKIKYFFVTIFLCCFAVSCQQPEIEALSEIKVSDTYLSIDVKGGSATLDITTTDAWEIDTQSVPEWLTITPTSGSAGDSKLTFSAAETKTTNKAEVKLLCAGKTQYINIIQYAEKVEPKIMSVTEALEIIKPLGAGKVADGLYRVKGIVCKISEISAQYGNATYYLSDDGSYKGSTKEDANWIQVYRGLWLNGAAFTTGDEFAIGDELVIEGALMDYKGIPETQEKNAYVISITKSLIGIDKLELLGAAEGEGVSEFPLEGGAIKVTLKNKGNGFRISIPEAAKSWLHIADFGSDFVTLEAEANTGGDRDVAVSFSTEANGTTYSCEQIFTQSGVAKGSGTDDDPYNVAAAVSYTKALGADVQSEQDIFVKGIISSVKYTYSAEFGTATYNISDDGTENGVFTVYGSYYFDNKPWTEEDEQIKVGDEVVVCGKVIYYKGTTPEFSNKENWLVSLNGKTSFVVATIADFLAAEVGDTRYSLTGIISQFYYYKENVAGFYIKDYSGETLVYKAEGFTGTEAKVGDIVTVVGKRGAYKETPQMVNGSMILNYAVTELSVADFRNLPDNKESFYMLTGKVTQPTEDGTKWDIEKYGNFNLTDETGSVYIYGVYAGWGGKKGEFGPLGVKEGDELTIVAYKTSYNGLTEGVGYYFSHKAAE